MLIVSGVAGATVLFIALASALQNRITREGERDKTFLKEYNPMSKYQEKRFQDFMSSHYVKAGLFVKKRLGPDNGSHDDIIQIAFARMSAHWGRDNYRWALESQQEALMFKCLHSSIGNYIKSLNVTGQIVSLDRIYEDEVYPTLETASVEDVVLYKKEGLSEAEFESIIKTLESLPPERKLQAVLRLCDLDHKEIARVSDDTGGAVKQFWNRFTEKVKKEVRSHSQPS
jgi:DNA-directed RNA polymerase specialized sigma24 family protein